MLQHPKTIYKILLSWIFEVLDFQAILINTYEGYKKLGEEMFYFSFSI